MTELFNIRSFILAIPSCNNEKDKLKMQELRQYQYRFEFA